jgi:hypothetical protein
MIESKRAKSRLPALAPFYVVVVGFLIIPLAYLGWLTFSGYLGKLTSIGG